MSNKGIACCIGCVALGAVGAVLLMRHKDKVKPMAEDLLAKSMRLKDKAKDYAAQAKEEVKEVIEEARNINANAAGASSSTNES